MLHLRINIHVNVTFDYVVSEEFITISYNETKYCYILLSLYNVTYKCNIVLFHLYPLRLRNVVITPNLNML